MPFPLLVVLSTSYFPSCTTNNLSCALIIMSHALVEIILPLTPMSTPHHCAGSFCIHDEASTPFPLCLLHVVPSLSHNRLLSCCFGFWDLGAMAPRCSWQQTWPMKQRFLIDVLPAGFVVVLCPFHDHRHALS